MPVSTRKTACADSSLPRSQVSDRHRRRAHHEVHNARPPAPRRGLRDHRTGEERARPGRLRRSVDEEGPGGHDDHLARPAAAIADLGPRQGTVSTRRLPGRDRHPGLLRRPPQPLAARHEREHQRPAAPVLPQRHRLVPLDRRGPRRRRSRAQQQTTQDPRLEDPGRGHERAPTLAPTSRCCVDRLSPVSTPRSATPTGSSKPACKPRSGPSVTATTTPWPRPSTACTRPNSCSGKDRGREPTTSSSRPWDGSTGSTTPGCTRPWATGPQPRSNPSTTVRSTPPSDRSWENPPCSEPGAIHDRHMGLLTIWLSVGAAEDPVELGSDDDGSSCCDGALDTPEQSA